MVIKLYSYRDRVLMRFTNELRLCLAIGKPHRALRCSLTNLGYLSVSRLGFIQWTNYVLHTSRDIADSFSDSYLHGVISIQKKTDPFLFIHIQAMRTPAKLSPPATAQKEWPNRFRFGALCHLIKGAQATRPIEGSFLEVVKSWSLLLFSDCSQLTVNNTFPRNLCIWRFCLGNNRSYILLLGSIEIRKSSSIVFSVTCDVRTDINLPHK